MLKKMVGFHLLLDLINKDVPNDVIDPLLETKGVPSQGFSTCSASLPLNIPADEAFSKSAVIYKMGLRFNTIQSYICCTVKSKKFVHNIEFTETNLIQFNYYRNYK